jgi:5,6,7,8-tetrahydromethanopterin hydro-lyase
MSRFTQIDERRRATSLRPIGILALEPEDLARLFDLRFDVDERRTSTAALLETQWGRQYMLLRHFDDPQNGTEVLASEESTDPQRDLGELLNALNLDWTDVTWRLDPHEAEASRLEREHYPPASPKPAPSARIVLATGEALVGAGNELAHIELVIGSKIGPVGMTFAKSFVNKEGHTNLRAVISPNLPAKPDTVITNKVTIESEQQAVQLVGPAQAAIARAVVDSVSEDVIPRDHVDDLCIIVTVFIHWEAADDKKIYNNNYEAAKTSIARALSGVPTVDDVLADTPAARLRFVGGAEG